MKAKNIIVGIIIAVLLVITSIITWSISNMFHNSEKATLIKRLADTETIVTRQKKDSSTIAMKYGASVSSQNKLFNELSNINGLYQKLFKEKSAAEAELKKANEYIAAMVTLNRTMALERDSLLAKLVNNKYTYPYSDKWVDLTQTFDIKTSMFGFKLNVRDELKLILAGHETGYMKVLAISSNPYMVKEQTLKMSYDPEKFSNAPATSYFPWGLATDAGLVMVGWFGHSLLK